MNKHSLDTPTATSKPVKLPKKIIALKHLLTTSLISPEAHFLYKDSALHSTISSLWNIHNIGFDRQPEKHGIYDALFTRYTLQESSRERALNLIKHYEGRTNNV